MGRPSKYDEDRADELIEAAKLGASVEGCGRAAGVTGQTVKNWLERAQDPDDDTIPEQFFEDFTRARWEGEKRLIEAGREKRSASFIKFLLSTSFDYQESNRTELEVNRSEGTSDEVSDKDALELEEYTEAFRGRFSTDN